MKSHRRLNELLRLARCWDDDPPDELAQRIEEERKRVTPPQELVDMLDNLRRAFATASATVSRGRYISFLGEVYKAVSTLPDNRILRRQDDLKAALENFFGVSRRNRDAFQMILIAVCGELVDRKIRHRWAKCLRIVSQYKTPAAWGAAQISGLGGINRCAGSRRRRSSI